MIHRPHAHLTPQVQKSLPVTHNAGHTPTDLGPDLTGSGLPGTPSAPFPSFGNLHLGLDSGTKRRGPVNPPFFEGGEGRVRASDSRRTTPPFISLLRVPGVGPSSANRGSGTTRVPGDTDEF